MILTCFYCNLQKYILKPEKTLTRHPILFYDSDCVLCSQSVRWLILCNKKGKVKISSLSSQAAKALEHDFKWIDSVVFYYDGKFAVKSAAIKELCFHLGFPFGFIGWFIRIIPAVWADLLYDFVAKNRFRWFGRTNKCRLPSATEKEMFLS